ncbi:MAG: hypothetical protein R3C99_23125 [Pirellulaceae bacterium]
MQHWLSDSDEHRRPKGMLSRQLGPPAFVYEFLSDQRDKIPI